MINVRRHGAVGDGATDDTPSFLSAIAEMAVAYWQPLYIPTGTYRLTQPLNFVSNGRIMGDGPGMSWLVWDSGDGIIFTSTSNDQEFLDVSDISLRTQTAGGVALKADFTAQVQNGLTIGRNPQRFIIRNCFFWPHFGADNGWRIAFDMIAGLYGLVTGCNVFGTASFPPNSIPLPAAGTIGLRFRGTAPNVLENGRPVAFMVRDSNFAYQENSIVFEGCEGGFVSGCNLVGVTNGIVWDSSVPNFYRPQLCVTGGHINMSGIGINASDLGDAQISQILFYNFMPNRQPSSTGIRLYGNYGALCPMITNNTFGGVLQTMDGIVVEHGSYGLISGNLFHNDVGTAIKLDAATDHFKGSDNIFAPTTAVGVSDSGSANTVS